MALWLSKVVILHVPKTGSAWTRAACFHSVETQCREIGEWHAPLDEVLAHFEKTGATRPLLGTFVRHPLAWYRSAWTYWMETGRFPRGESDPVVEHPDFEVFVRNCLTLEPRGYVSALYRRYTGLDGEADVTIGRQEQLAEDLVRLLLLANEPFDECRLRATPPCNVRGSKRTGPCPPYSEELVRAVLNAEVEVLDRYYASEKTKGVKLLWQVKSSPLQDRTVSCSLDDEGVNSGK